MGRTTTTRAAAVAGRFYPDSPDALRRLLRRLDGAARCVDPPTGALKAVIAPHAGYSFSGPIAASVFRHVRHRRTPTTRVVLFGPAHYEAFSGLAASTAGAFATPLGDVAVDRDAVETLLDLPEVLPLDSPHAPEHALEVELPMLIDVLGGADRFTIVPLLFGDTDSAAAAAALDAVWGGDETLIVISSDLSHHLDHATATHLDRATADAIVAGERQAVGPSQACGHTAIRGLMRVAAGRGLTATCVDLRNSGDTAPRIGGRDRVVGYGGFLFTG